MPRIPFPLPQVPGLLPAALALLLAAAPAALAQGHAGHDMAGMAGSPETSAPAAGGQAMPGMEPGMAHDMAGSTPGQAMDDPAAMYPRHPWADPAVPVTPPPPLTGKGKGRVVSPNLPSLGYELDGRVKVFRLTAQPVERAILDGPPPPDSPWARMHASEGAMAHMSMAKKARLWGFNGTAPGPTVEVDEGDTVRFIVKNELPEPTSIHWHSVEVPNRYDGVGGLTQRPIMPGETFVYEFTLHQHGTFMYHSSFNEHKQVGMGLGGMLIVHPKKPGRAVDRDIAIMLNEFMFRPGSDLPEVSSTDPNWFTFNGKSAPSTGVITVRQGDRVRIRFANPSSLHPHPIHLHGFTWRVTGTEGGPIPPSAQWPGNTVLVASGTTRDVEFTADNPGLWHFHCHILHHIVNGHADVPMGVMPMGGMAVIFEVLPAGSPAPKRQPAGQGWGLPSGPPAGQGGMDHGTMDHGSMDHGTMGHGDPAAMPSGRPDSPGPSGHAGPAHGGEAPSAPMDHGQMDHGQMDHGQTGHAPPAPNPPKGGAQ